MPLSYNVYERIGRHTVTAIVVGLHANKSSAIALMHARPCNDLSVVLRRVRNCRRIIIIIYCGVHGRPTRRCTASRRDGRCGYTALCLRCVYKEYWDLIISSEQKEATGFFLHNFKKCRRSFVIFGMKCHEPSCRTHFTKKVENLFLILAIHYIVMT